MPQLKMRLTNEFFFGVAVAADRIVDDDIEKYKIENQVKINRNEIFNRKKTCVHTRREKEKNVSKK